MSVLWSSSNCSICRSRRDFWSSAILSSSVVQVIFSETLDFAILSLLFSWEIFSHKSSLSFINRERISESSDAKSDSILWIISHPKINRSLFFLEYILFTIVYMSSVFHNSSFKSWWFLCIFSQREYIFSISLRVPFKKRYLHVGIIQRGIIDKNTQPMNIPGNIEIRSGYFDINKIPKKIILY